MNDETGLFKTVFSGVDPGVLHIVLIAAIALIVLTLAAILLRSVSDTAQTDKNEQDADIPGHLDLLVRDLNNRLLNYMTQSREDLSFLKQEIKTIRTDITEVKAVTNRLTALNGVDEEVSEISSRVSDLIQLLRDEDITRSTELREMKSLMLRILMLEADRIGEKRLARDSMIKDLKAL